MKTFVKVDNKNFKEIVDFYYSLIMQMAKTGPHFAKIIQEIPEIEKKFYSYVQNEISSKKGENIEIDYNLRLSSNQKFIKKAILPAVLGPALSAIGGEAMKEILAGGLGADESGILGKFKGVFDKFGILEGLLNSLKKMAKGFIKEATDLDLLKKLLILDKTFQVETEKEKFSPSAYEFLLESKTGPRGIDGSYVSKGAYDLPSKKLYEQYEEAKRTTPELFEKKMDFPEFEKYREQQKPTIFYDDTKGSSGSKPKPNMQFQPLYKKLKYDGKDTEASSENKFIKVSQTTQNSAPVVSQQVAEDVKKLFPKWKFDDLINEIKIVSANNEIDDTAKQEQFRQVIAKYEKSIEPLHKYIQDLTKQK
jgi:hypothetical protein